MPKKNNVKPLKIMIETNVSEKPFPLTFSNIYNPLVSEIPSNVVMNEYPYFIETIPYPEEILAKKEYSELLRVFFNEDEFINTIVKRSSHASNADYDIEIVEKNIIIMLNLIFPTSYPSSNNINTSFNKYLQKKITEHEFRKTLQIQDKKIQKNRVFYNIFRLFVDTFTDILYRFHSECIQPNWDQTFTTINEVNEIRKYTNECLEDVSNTYKSIRYYINKNVEVVKYTGIDD
jgi:hypothetical protein